MKLKMVSLMQLLGRGHALPALAAVCLGGCAAVYPPGVSVQAPTRQVGADGADLAQAAKPGSALPPPEYRLNPGDQLSLRFPMRPAYSDTYVVRSDGRISVPVLGSVAAASLTPDELQDALVARYRQLVKALPPATERSYRLQAADVLDVRFSFFPDLNSTVTIRPDGRITLPMVGEVLAEGVAPLELQQRLIAQYKGRVPNPELVVSVRELRTNVFFHNDELKPLPDPGLMELAVNVTKTLPLVVYVGGEVPTPGVQQYTAGVNALQTIFAAGGPAITADLRSVVVLRRGANDSVIRVVADLSQDLAGAGTGNLVLQPFDVVVVPRSKVVQTGDTIDQYLYRIVRPLANSNIGFYFARQVGSADQRTTIQP